MDQHRTCRDPQARWAIGPGISWGFTVHHKHRDVRHQVTLWTVSGQKKEDPMRSHTGRLKAWARGATMLGSMVLGCSISAQGLEWMRSIGGIGDDVATSVAHDGDGSTLLAGYFEGEVDMDPGPGEWYFNSNGGLDAFVMKLDASGGLDWLLQLGGDGTDYATSVSTDLNGNVYVAGTYMGTMDMDPGTGSMEITSAGDQDIFMAKYSSDGTFLDAWSIGGEGYDEPKCVAVGSLGNVYLLSYFSGTIDADPGPGILPISSQGQLDMLLQRFNGDGECTWAQGTGSTGTDLGLSMALDADENMWVTGSFEGTVDFDPGVGSVTLISAGAWDIFVTKRSSSGELLWAGRMGGVENFDTGYDIAVDGDGSAVVAGSFFGSGDFDPGAGVHTLTASSVGSDDIFAVKLSSIGEMVWAVGLGGMDGDLGYGVCVAGDGRVLLTGFFSGTADFDPDPSGVYELSTSPQGNYFDGFLCTLDPAGEFMHAVQFGGAGSIAAQPMAMGPNDELTIAGHFEGTVDMDPTSGQALVSSGGFRDAFVLQFAGTTTGMQEPSNGSTPMLYPDPASDHIVMEVDQTLAGTPYVVMDGQGRAVARGRLEGTRTYLPLASWADGNYLLHLLEADRRSVRFMVKR